MGTSVRSRRLCAAPLRPLLIVETAFDARAGSESPRDIFVDLDGTLIRTDIFAESLLRYVRDNPLRLVSLPLLLMRGRAAAKAAIARAAPIDLVNLPYEQKLIEHLRERRRKGARLVLATACHWRRANAIAAEVGIFDAVMASDARTNLKGARKLQAIEAAAEGRPFAYAGDSGADRPIWKAAASVITVNAPARDVREARRSGRLELSLRTRSHPLKALLREMRPHQWIKNVLLFAPLFTSHLYTDLRHDLMALAGFAAFCLAASGHYIFNDLLDLDADRAHAVKRRRPLASGDLTLAAAALASLVLTIAAFALSLAVMPVAFTVTLAGYFALTNAYSLFIKRVSTADIMTLALLYTLRVLAGATAISVLPSSWLLGFSVFVFSSLAYLKRYVEIAALPESAPAAKGRRYSRSDAEALFSLGVAMGTAAVVVLALYISSADVRALYRRPDILWALCFLMLYWNNRLWMGARRGKINDDPVIFAIRDRASRAIGAVFLAVVIAARFWP